MRPARGVPRKTAGRCVAALAAACLLAACTGSPAGSRAGGAGRHNLTPAHRFIGRPPIARRVIIISGAGGGVAPSIFIGGLGGGGLRPAITVPAIPPGDASLAVPIPLAVSDAVDPR